MSKKEKIGLVLEGGGMRGAYTAGVLAWFLDNDFKFDYIVGISSGALYGSMFAMGKKETLKDASIYYATDKKNVGLRSLFTEGTLVAYDYMFDTLSTKLDYPLEEMDQIDMDMDVGVYDYDKQETVWVDQKAVAKYPDYIKAACTLPIFGKPVTIEGVPYMDGGITTMIPVTKSLEKGCDKHVIVTTKSQNYVRKPQGFLEKHFLRLRYRNKPALVEAFENRRDVYYEERDLINSLVTEKKAVYLYPSEELGVGRFSGTHEQFQALFDLAYKDCEARKEALYKLYQSE